MISINRACSVLNSQSAGAYSGSSRILSAKTPDTFEKPRGRDSSPGASSSSRKKIPGFTLGSVLVVLSSFSGIRVQPTYSITFLVTGLHGN